MKSAELKNSLLLYAVTDRMWLGGNFPCKTLHEAVEQAVEGGATIVQLREKAMDEADFLAEAQDIKKICAARQIPLIINDNIQVAVKSGADGVHIGQHDMSMLRAREILGQDKIIGVSCQTVGQAVQAEKDGADYLGVGAVFATSTKNDADSVSIETLKEICAAVKIPVVAIGGITNENMELLKGSGIAGISVISAIFAQKDIRQAARNLLESSAGLFSQDS
ncbi:thiamine phosphate synthase [Treponema sp.]|uniref:thiamine phosphate synthase n=1 Tax=Treponema sp. TaxID=166 RepID=UPI003EFC7855